MKLSSYQRQSPEWSLRAHFLIRPCDELRCFRARKRAAEWCTLESRKAMESYWWKYVYPACRRSRFQ